MVGRFKPVTGVMGVRVGQFTLPGNNAGFCAAILQKSGAQPPLRLESLTYIRPDRREAAAQPPQQTLVVNLLMQLRAYYDQSNTYLRNQAALNIQLTNQLRQALTLSTGPVRARAGAIQRAVQGNLYREGEFQRALDSLARELKKNDYRTPELTVRLPGPSASSGQTGRASLTVGSAGGTGRQETQVLRAPAFSGGIQGADAGAHRMEPPMVHRTPSQAEPRETAAEPARRGRRKAAEAAAPAQAPASAKSRGRKAGTRAAEAAAAPAQAPEADQTATQAPAPAKSRGRKAGTRAAEAATAPAQAGERIAHSTPAGAEGQAQSAPRRGGAGAPEVIRPAEQFSGAPVLAVLRRYPAESGGQHRLSRPFSTALRSRMPTVLPEAGWFPATSPILYQLRYASPGRSVPGAGLAPLTNRLATDFERTLSGRERARERTSLPSAGPSAPAQAAEAGYGGSRPGPARLVGTGQRSTAAPPYISADVDLNSGTPAVGAPAALPVTAPLPPRAHLSLPDATALAGTRLPLLSRVPRLGRVAGEGRETAPAAQGAAMSPAALVSRQFRLPGTAPGAGQTGPGALNAIPRNGGDAPAEATLVGALWLPAAVPPPAEGAIPGPAPAVGAWPDMTFFHFPRPGGASVAALPAGQIVRQTGAVSHTPNAAPAPAFGWRQRSAAARTAPARGRTGGLVAPAAGISRIFRTPADPGARQSTPGAPASRTAPTAFAGSAAVWLAGGPYPAAEGPAAAPAGFVYRTAEDAAVFAPPSEGVGGTLLRMQRAVRGLLAGEGRGTWRAVHRMDRAAAAMAVLEAARDTHTGPAAPAWGAPFFSAGRSGRLPVRQTGDPEPLSAAKALRLSASSVPPLRTAGQRALQADTEPAAQRTPRPDARNGTPIIHRRPEHPAPAQGAAGEDSGEAVLKAQTMSPAQAAALSAACSYPPGGGTGKDPARPAAELTREQEERITQRVLDDINYNRMASEVLDRVERRLRAERRKFGR